LEKTSQGRSVGRDRQGPAEITVAGRGLSEA
jgi:hypothetical protein